MAGDALARGRAVLASAGISGHGSIGMLKSVVKEIFFKRGRRALEDKTPDENGRYYRFDTMVGKMRQLSESLHRTAHNIPGAAMPYRVR